MRDTDLRVRCNTAVALGIIGRDGNRCVPALVNALKVDGALTTEEWTKLKVDDCPSCVIIHALSKFGPEAKPAVPLLIAAIKDNKAQNAKHIAAIEALAQIGAEAADAVPILQDLTKDMYSGIYRSRALSALKRIGPVWP